MTSQQQVGGRNAATETLRRSLVELNQRLSDVNVALDNEYQALRVRDTEALVRAVEGKNQALAALVPADRAFAEAVRECSGSASTSDTSGSLGGDGWLQASASQHGFTSELNAVRQAADKCKHDNRRNGMLVAAAHTLNSRLLRLLTGSEPVYGNTGQLDNEVGGRRIAEA